MWTRLIIGGFFTAVGISLLISVCIAPISPRCVRFYGGLGILILLPSLFFFARGLKAYAAWVRQLRRKQ